MTRLDFVMISRSDGQRRRILKNTCPGYHVTDWPRGDLESCPSWGKKRRYCKACWNTEIEEADKL